MKRVPSVGITQENTRGDEKEEVDDGSISMQGDVKEVQTHQ